jgi:hypothetical protein
MPALPDIQQLMEVKDWYQMPAPVEQAEKPPWHVGERGKRRQRDHFTLGIRPDQQAELAHTEPEAGTLPKGRGAHLGDSAGG